MNKELESEDEIIVNTEDFFYYVDCPFCRTEFAIWEFLKKDALGYGIPSDEDIVKLCCPLCKQDIPLVVEKAPRVHLNPWPEEMFEE